MAVAGFVKSFILLQSTHFLRPPQILHDIVVPHFAATSTRRRNISSLYTEDSLIKLLTEELKELAEERRVRKAAPEWLPFRPGSSYWLPGSKHLRYEETERSLEKHGDREKIVLLESPSDSET